MSPYFCEDFLLQYQLHDCQRGGLSLASMARKNVSVELTLGFQDCKCHENQVPPSPASGIGFVSFEFCGVLPPPNLTGAGATQKQSGCAAGNAGGRTNEIFTTRWSHPIGIS